MRFSLDDLPRAVPMAGRPVYEIQDPTHLRANEWTAYEDTVVLFGFEALVDYRARRAQREIAEMTAQAQAWVDHHFRLIHRLRLSCIGIVMSEDTQ